ncbi:MAG TPA: hypothetical protein VGF99_22385 [Myxococcota bacterium]
MQKQTKKLCGSVVAIGVVAVIGCIDVDDTAPDDVREPRAVAFEFTHVKASGSARPGQAFRGGVLADAQLLDDTTLIFRRECTDCGGQSGTGVFRQGITVVADNIDDGRALIDLDTIEAWALERDAALIDGTIGNVESMAARARWLLSARTPGPDHDDAQPDDLVVDGVEATVWMATALEVVTTTDAAAAEVARVLRTPGEDRDEQLGRILIADGGTIRVAVASTIHPAVLAAVDSSACTVTSYRACADVIAAWRALIVPTIDVDDLADVMAGTNDFWQPLRFSTTTMIADE